MRPESASPPLPDQPPRVFFSYSWDDEGHIRWVSALAQRLETDGIQVMRDDSVRLGGDLALFMESLHRADRVLLICTPSYKTKADERLGGVGYETRLLAARLIKDQKNTFAIPLLRKGSWDESGPWWTGSTRYLDFREETSFESQYMHLLETLQVSSRETVPAMQVPKIRLVRPAPARLTIFLILLVLTVVVPMMAPREAPLIKDGPGGIEARSQLDRYNKNIYLRLELACLLLVGAGLMIRSEYRAGMASESLSGRSEALVGLATLAGTTCFSSLLNNSLLHGKVVAEVPALAWPERLSYVYLAAGFLVLAYNLLGTVSFRRRSS
jgi:hypothetical protein